MTPLAFLKADNPSPSDQPKGEGLARQETTSGRKHQVWPSRLIALAVGYQWIYNGVNFLAFKVSVEALPAIVVASLRFTTAGLVLLPFAIRRFRRGARASRRQLASAALLGLVLLVAGQALAIWGVGFLPAGVASVFGSTAPLFLALFSWVLFRRPLARWQLAGIAIGFAGLALMGWNSATGVGFRPVGAAAMLAASASWAGGSLLAIRLDLPQDPVVDLAAQLLPAGALLGTIALATGTIEATDFGAVPGRAWGALTYLVVASTLIGYATFIALNRNASSTLANTYNYVAPVVALGLSALILHEPLTTTKVIAAAIALAGVALIIAGAGRQPRVSSGALPPVEVNR